MDAALEEKWKKFSLSEEEKGIMAVSSQEVSYSKQRAKFSILFKLLASKEFNEEAFKSTIQKLWCGLHGVTIKEKQFKGDLSPGDVSFQHSPFWIRVFNIPIKSMNSCVGTRIANEIGVPILVDAPKNGLASG
nr:hypothetical protein CFP56_24719 [Quercus suber]